METVDRTGFENQGTGLGDVVKRRFESMEDVDRRVRRERKDVAAIISVCVLVCVRVYGFG